VSADGDDDRTILRPTPGGRRAATQRPASEPPAAPAEPAPPPPQGAARPEPASATAAPPGEPLEISDSSANPLIAAGATLLTLASQLRGAVSHADVPALRQRALQEVKAFDQRAREAGVSPEDVNTARYALCALLDETVLNTPWGSQSVWATESLLITLYRERTGGERIFQIISALSEQPGGNLHLLEFLFVCLSLGFQGKYGIIPNGQQQLERVRADLYHTIRRQRRDGGEAISPHWQGLRDPRPRVARTLPLWVAVACAGAVITGLFVAFTLMLNAESDTAFARLNDLARDTTAARPVAAQTLVEPEEGTRGVPEVVDDLRAELAPEIEAGRIEVFQAGNRARILLRNRGLFPSGSASVTDAYRPVLDKVARATAGAPRPILVTGHSDNVPIRTVRFPSNWHLSKARAEAVVDVLARGPGEAGRFVAEGRADNEPIADNTSAAGREKNRRVEINLRPW